MAGTPWIAKEWLSQVVFALADRAGGWPAVALLAALSVATAFTLLAREALARLTPLTVLILCGAVFPLVAGHVIARPHVLAWAPMVAVAIVLMRAAEDTRAPSWLALPLMTLWANLHGSFLLGLALVPVFAADALTRAEPAVRTRLALGWAAFGLAAALATLIHPYGFGVWAAALSVLGLDGAGLGIAEWKAADFSRLGAMEVALLAGLAALATTGRRVPLARLLLILGLAHLALAHVRHMAVFGFLAALVLIEPMSAPAPNAGEGTTARDAGHRPRLFAPLACLAAAIAIVAAFLRPDVAPDAANRPTAALAAARAAGVTGNVVNEYGFGGWLITQGVPTFLDGRTELYGAPRVAEWRDAASLADLAAFDRIFADPRVGWTLLPPGLPAVALLDRTPGWKRLHTDGIAVVHVRAR